MPNIPSGRPGVAAIVTVQARNIFLSGRERAQFNPYPVVIDGTLSSDPTNTPYVWMLQAGLMLGIVTTGRKFAAAIIGVTTVATLASAVTITVGVATAIELVRRVGGSGTFTLTGPPTVAGANASFTVTYSAVNTGTGVITCNATSAAAVVGSLIQPTDGSQNIVTVIADPFGVKVVDSYNSVRIDNFAAKLLNGGGVINTAMLLNYTGRDVSIRNAIKTALRNASAGVSFSDDLL